MTKNLRVGLVGTGFGTQVHLPAFRACEGIEVVAICSAQRERARQAAEHWGIPWFSDDFNELVALPEVDLVDVCTPPSTHLDITLAAVNAGKHVLSEKPIALNCVQAKSMVDSVRDSAQVNVVNHEMRYAPVRRTIRDLVSSGFLGEVQFVSAVVNTGHGTDPTKEPYYWGWVSEAAKGGGFLMSSLSHHVDLLRFCFGELVDVRGGVATLIRERPVLTFEYRDGDPIGPDTPTRGLRAVDADDAAAFTARLAGGGLVSVSGSWSLHHPEGIHLTAHGDQGSLRLTTDGRLYAGRNGDEELREIQPSAHLRSIPDSHYLASQFAALADDVSGVIRGSTKPNDALFATFEDGYRLQRIIDTVKGEAVPEDPAVGGVLDTPRPVDRPTPRKTAGTGPIHG